MRRNWSAAELIEFEDEIAALMKEGRIGTPTHLCGGNEEQLRAVFASVRDDDWVFCSYRNHYHALLYGVPREEVRAQILAGRSMTPQYPGRKFFTSAIVAGQIPAAVGAAAALKRSGSESHVWCFLGDMAAMTGIYTEAKAYAGGQKLPITFVVEDNGLACDTPTLEVWGSGIARVQYYRYERKHPHLGGA